MPRSKATPDTLPEVPADPPAETPPPRVDAPPAEAPPQPTAEDAPPADAQVSPPHSAPALPVGVLLHQENTMKNAFLTALLRTVASKAIPALEEKALTWLAQNKGDLKGKAELALDYGMEEYARLTAKIPMLAATTIDDTMVRQQLKEALDWAWVRIDDEIKQAARDVKQKAEAGVTVTDPYVPSESPPTGVPLEDKHFGPMPGQDRD